MVKAASPDREPRVETFRIVEPAVLHQSIDGEVIAIDNRTGSYFSMRGVAALCWGALGAGAAPAALAADLARAYALDLAQAEAAVQAFVAELEAAGLIARAAPAGPPPALALGADRPAWAPPRLDAYTDLQALLLFDPIHEVTEEGWPAIDPGARER
jgi:hypothetical protein